MDQRIRVFGVILFLAGIALLGAEFVWVFWGTKYMSAADLTPINRLGSSLFFTGALLLSLGSFGLYFYQSQKIGAWGTFTFFMAASGSILMVVMDWMELFATNMLIQARESDDGLLMFGAALCFFGYIFGWMLFGITTLRLGVLPRIPAILLVVGAVLVLIIDPESNRLLDLIPWIPGWGWR
jgi:hypothetical protein